MEHIFFLSDDTLNLIINNARSLARLLLSMSIGLFIANALEALHWTRFMQKLTKPFVRFAHMQSVAGVAFSVAFASPGAANAMLGEAYRQNKISKKELVFSNLLNSTPTFLVHLPSVTMLLYAFIGTTAFIYTGFTLLAALLRTFCTMLVGRFSLPPAPPIEPEETSTPKSDTKQMLLKSLKRTRKRLTKLITYAVPCYLLISIIQYMGGFAAVEQWMLKFGSYSPWLRPELFGIISLSLMAETGVAFSAAASLSDAGTISSQEVIVALLIGSIISAPMRAVRHQFPSYAGYYSPAIALLLILVGQGVRALSLIFVTALYIWLAA